MHGDLTLMKGRIEDKFKPLEVRLYMYTAA